MLGLGVALGALDRFDQEDALDRERRLVDQGIEQPALLGCEQRTLPVGGEVELDADACTLRMLAPVFQS